MAVGTTSETELILEGQIDVLEVHWIEPRRCGSATMLNLDLRDRQHALLEVAVVEAAAIAIDGGLRLSHSQGLTPA